MDSGPSQYLSGEPMRNRAGPLSLFPYVEGEWSIPQPPPPSYTLPPAGVKGARPPGLCHTASWLIISDGKWFTWFIISDTFSPIASDQFNAFRVQNHAIVGCLSL